MFVTEQVKMRASQCCVSFNFLCTSIKKEKKEADVISLFTLVRKKAQKIICFLRAIAYNVADG